MISNSFLLNYSYLKLTDLTTKANFFAFTFGRYNPWPIEYIPPSVPPDLSTPPQLFAYLKTSSIIPVITVTQSSTFDFSFNDSFYKKISNSFSEISSNKCSHVCFEATLVHNNLPQSSWRSFGLAIASAALTEVGIVPSSLASLPTFYHIYTQYAGPRTKENNVTETVRLVLPVSSIL